MADGAVTPIEDVNVGDFVLARDPDSRRTEAGEVIAVWVHDDTMFELVLAGGSRIRTTEDHLFWNVAKHEWEEARDLSADDALLDADAKPVAVDHFEWSAETSAAYNLTVGGVHTYFVVAGDTPVLVHNDGSDSTVGTIFRSGPYAFVIRSNDHGPPHGHLIGKGYDIQIGQNGKPLDPKVTLTREQQQIVDANKRTIRTSIANRMVAYRLNGC